jgi:hypothetical protein
MSMTNELICPNCHIALDEQQLLAHTWSVETCPHCRAVVRRHEATRWRDKDAANHEDVQAIEAWLDDVTRDVGVRDPSVTVAWRPVDRTQGKYGWEITGAESLGTPSVWVCTVEYDSDSPHVCEVRLTSDQDGQVFLHDPSPLSAACGEHGVQAHASEERHWVEWEAERQVVRWGARQLLATGSLHKGLFQAVVRRLGQAMRQATVRAERVRPGSTASEAGR